MASISAAYAGAWIDTGDVALRHHVQVLADTGVLKTPVTTWPLPWEAISTDLNRVDPKTLSGASAQSYAWLREQMLAQKAPRHVRRLRAEASNSDPALRAFGATRRESAGLTFQHDIQGDAWALRLGATAVSDPIDDDSVRPDDVYLAGRLGNWWFAAGTVDRWWGPGWQSSLILSDNARPVPALMLQRAASEAPPWWLLKWVGPWQFTTFAGRMEDDRAVPNPFLLGARFTFKPWRYLELGASRTAQWGGEGRPQDFESLVNLILGQDNRGQAGITEENEPGNQLGEYGFRLSLPTGGLQNALYFQELGEDEANYLPSRHVSLGGFESAFMAGGWQHRLAVEYADTDTHDKFFGSHVLYNYTYEHGIYQTGYRRLGRPIGASFDNDSRVATLMGWHLAPGGHIFQWSAGSLDLNRDGSNKSAPGGNPLGPANLQTTYGTLAYTRVWSPRWRITLGGEYYADDLTLSGEQITSNGYLAVEFRY